MARSWLLTISLALVAFVVNAQELSNDKVDQVRERLAESAALSWEIGTRMQALLEHDTTDFSVFASDNIPPPTSYSGNSNSGMSEVLSIAATVVGNRSESNHGATGPQPLMADGSAADPASIGVAVLLANWTGRNDHDYDQAAEQQLQYLLRNTPRTSDGAISHRVSQVQLWNDFVYMVPPFLAYYGVLAGNTTLISEAHNQIRLYRKYLKEDNSGLWMHVVMGSDFEDRGHWTTGNGWAAAGMLRVLATIQHSQYSDDFSDERSELKDWVNEIHASMYDKIDDTAIFRNYADNGKTFYDAAGTALLASSVYRTAVLTGDLDHVVRAEWCRKSIVNLDNGHIDSDGWLTPVVNPHSFGNEGEHSPEGQAFVLMMQAAWSDWEAAGAPGNDAVGLRYYEPWGMLVVMVICFAVML